MIKKFDDELDVLIHALDKRSRVLADVLFDFGKTLYSSDELNELDMRQQQLNEIIKLSKKLKSLKDGTDSE